jgi:hypothetical protein
LRRLLHKGNIFKYKTYSIDHLTLRLSVENDAGGRRSLHEVSSTPILLCFYNIRSFLYYRKWLRTSFRNLSPDIIPFFHATIIPAFQHFRAELPHATPIFPRIRKPSGREFTGNILNLQSRCNLILTAIGHIFC